MTEHNRAKVLPAWFFKRKRMNELSLHESLRKCLTFNVQFSRFTSKCDRFTKCRALAQVFMQRKFVHSLGHGKWHDTGFGLGSHAPFEQQKMQKTSIFSSRFRSSVMRWCRSWYVYMYRSYVASQYIQASYIAEARASESKHGIAWSHATHIMSDNYMYS